MQKQKQLQIDRDEGDEEDKGKKQKQRRWVLKQYRPSARHPRHPPKITIPPASS